MKSFTLVAVAVLCLAIWWKVRRTASTGAPSVVASSDHAGWVTMAPPTGSKPNQVLIVAPPNCPSAEAKRAGELARQLNAEQIPNTQTGTVEFMFASMDEAKRAEEVMKGGAPIVFVNRKAKANPSLAEVVAEYRAVASR